jgi:hypothetical protein
VPRISCSATASGPRAFGVFVGAVAAVAVSAFGVFVGAVAAVAVSAFGVFVGAVAAVAVSASRQHGFEQRSQFGK